MPATPMVTSPWSDVATTDHNDVRARVEAEQHALERLRATRAVASAARDVKDARLLLDILGLTETAVQSVGQDATAAALTTPTKSRAAASRKRQTAA